MIRCCIFDLDGTLYKTHVTELPLLRRLCAARNLILTPQDEYYLLHTTARHLLARVAPDMPEAEILRFSEELRQGELIEVRAHGELFEGGADPRVTQCRIYFGDLRNGRA